jgi:hypothetical protein
MGLGAGAGTGLGAGAGAGAVTGLGTTEKVAIELTWDCGPMPFMENVALPVLVVHPVAVEAG